MKFCVEQFSSSFMTISDFSYFIIKDIFSVETCSLHFCIQDSHNFIYVSYFFLFFFIIWGRTVINSMETL